MDSYCPLVGILQIPYPEIDTGLIFGKVKVSPMILGKLHVL